MTGLDALAVLLVAAVALAVAGGVLAVAADAGARRRVALPVAAAVALLVGILLPVPSPAAADGIPACVVEDGSSGPLPCFWDAQHRGNGRGTSVVIP